MILIMIKYDNPCQDCFTQFILYCFGDLCDCFGLFINCLETNSFNGINCYNRPDFLQFVQNYCSISNCTYCPPTPFV